MNETALSHYAREVMRAIRNVEALVEKLPRTEEREAVLDDLHNARLTAARLPSRGGPT